MGRNSSKRKSSKLHSEVRRKKKNRISKSKKLSSRKDTTSCSRKYSRSSVSISSSSSEDEHYRSRSCKKGELKCSKKRAREKSSTKGDKVSKMKKPRKKKLRREPSFTSLSSDSSSGSAYSVRSDTKKKLRKKRRKRESSIASATSYSSSDENREVESRRGRLRKKSEGEKGFGKTKSLKVGSRSCSPYDRYKDGIDYSELIVPAEKSSRRLKSVITVLKPPEDEERELIGDGLNEEIMHDHGDKPSYRSNDIGNKGIKNLLRDEDSVSSLKSTKVTKGDGVINSAGNKNKREEISPVLPSTENDLESILRLKALENMIKYKGAQIEKLKSPTELHNSNVKEQDQIKKLNAPTKVRSSIIEEQFHRPVTNKSELSTVPEKTEKPKLAMDKNVVNENSENTFESVPIASKNGRVLKSSVSGMSIIPKKTQNPNSLLAESNVDKKAPLTSENEEQARKNVEQDIVLKSSIPDSIKNIPDKVQDAKSLVAESTENNIAAVTSAIPGQASKKDEQDTNVPKSSISEPSSSLKPPPEENISKEHQSTDKDGSQFEQKTMSVMRGGEMVQVSYKVYIPTKAPALTRKPLIRR